MLTLNESECTLTVNEKETTIHWLFAVVGDDDDGMKTKIIEFAVVCASQVVMATRRTNNNDGIPRTGARYRP